MLKATLAAAVFLSTPLCSFLSFLYLLTSQLWHIKNANNLQALYVEPDPVAGSSSSGHAPGPGYWLSGLTSRRVWQWQWQRLSPCNSQRVKSKRFNIYGTLYSLWAYFKTFTTDPYSEQQMMIFQIHIWDTYLFIYVCIYILFLCINMCFMCVWAIWQLSV